MHNFDNKSERSDQDQGKTTLLLDGECVLCNKFTSFMHSFRDKSVVEFLGIQSDGQAIILTFSDELQKIDTVYAVTSESVKTKSSAVIHCLSLMSFPYRVLSVIIWLFPKFIRETAYDFVAKRRKSIFGVTDICVWDEFSSTRGTEQ